MLELRDYQKEAISKTYEFWSSGKGKNPLIVAPTGSGKSLIIAQICIDVCKDDDYSRVLILTHTKELLKQNADELISLWREATVGFYSAGLNKKDLKSRIIFAGVQSFINGVDDSEPFDLIIIDEAHMINNKAETRYKKVFDNLLSKNDKTKILGLTATPYRMAGGLIYGKNKMFCDVAYDIKIEKLIDEGYLVKPISKGALNKIDLSNVKIKSNGEFDDIGLALAVDSEELNQAVVNETIELGVNRKAWLVFATNVDHGNKLKDLFIENGIVTELITGETKPKIRDILINGFKDGKIKCLINVGVLTTGFNAPICDLVVMARATQSTSLFVQIIGRGLRTYPEKEDCLFLDFGDNVLRHGTLDNIIPVSVGNGKKKNQEEIIKAKECKECGYINHIQSRECVECGFIFKAQEVQHSDKVYDGAMLSKDILPQRYKIDNVSYSDYFSKSGNKCLKITYRSGLKFFSEFIVIDSYFGKKELISIGCDNMTIEEILNNQDSIKKPKFIIAKKEGKYMKVIDKEYIDFNFHCCYNCVKKTIYTETKGYKKEITEYCEVFGTVLDESFMYEENPCTEFDNVPF
ncbi:DEAD/DEAH box helicase [bacterium]|nr:DEAD/DEAH box helicase [bacterium]MBU1958627.1 DEAD/DEAH box helicase [bacterium]